MSAARTGLPLGLTGLRMKAEEYLALGETPDRYELIHGVVVMSPSPRPRHWKIMQEVVLQLGRYAEGGGAADVYAETDLTMDESTVFRPDVCVYARLPAPPFPDRLTAPPDLVVEVLSPGTEALDLITKRDGYEKRGVKEYWVIDPADARVRAWRLQGGRLVESGVEGDALPSTALRGFTLDLARLRRLAPPK